MRKVKISGNLSGTSRYWDLCMVDQFGDKRQLIGTMPDWNQAQFMKGEIERFLSRVGSEQERAETLPQA